MRLRYLHIPDLPPLRDVEIVFGHEPVLGRDCTVHFIAGVNGSGKSRLLRALTEVFLALKQPEVPPFPVTIAYDLGRPLPGQVTSQSLSTIYYRYTGQGKASAFMVVLEHIPLHTKVDWQHFHQHKWLDGDADALPYRKRRHLHKDNIAEVKAYLPTTVLAYTSGSPYEWKTAFVPSSQNLEERIDQNFPRVAQKPEDRHNIERPPNWNSHKEAIFNQSQQEIGGITPIAPSPGKSQVNEKPPGIGYFIQPGMLKLVVCAVALNQVLEEFQKYPQEREREAFEQEIENALEQGRHMDGMRAIFNAVDWLWPIMVGLQIEFRPERLETLKKEVSLLRKLYLIASKVISGSGPARDKRTLYFDLEHILDKPTHDEYHQKSTLEALASILGGENTSAFDIFKQLLELQKRGILEDITIALKKRKVESMLLYDQLSDGERVLLGRMALFHLLKGTDDTLIILDEPETHFNDLWKREVADMIDSALRHDTSEIVISTHSSIALTDVFDSEITVLKKDQRDATIYADRPTIRTFGTAPDEILSEIFGAQDSVGQRASEFLDLILIFAANWNLVQKIWQDVQLQQQIRKQNQLQEQSEGLNRQNGKRSSSDEQFEEFMKQDLKQSSAFEPFKEFVKRESGAYIASQSNVDLEDYLSGTLSGVYNYTRRHRSEVSIENVLDLLQSHLGPGYYQFEFRRRLRALRKDSNAASH